VAKDKKVLEDSAQQDNPMMKSKQPIIILMKRALHDPTIFSLFQICEEF
jgi:hypothetical protein